MTTFRFYVEVEVKNDAGTQESEKSDLAAMLMDCLQDNTVVLLPWVIDQHYAYINPKE